MRLVFWQNILSPHQAPYIRALANQSGWRVHVIAQEAMSTARKRLGLSIPDFGSATVDIASGGVTSLVKRFDKDTVHVLCGVRGCLLVRRVAACLRRSSARMGFVTEAADHRGALGVLRRGVYTWHGLRSREKIDFLLVIGTNGVRWYRSCRFPMDRTFPFLYVTDVPQSAISQRDGIGMSCEVAFVGRCVRGKGIETLLQSLQGVPGDWRLSVIGDGPMRADYERLALKLGLEKRCKFTGALPHESAMALLETMDLLVLPSDGKEGWGAVVNEALMRGVPAICSDNCGAQDLLREPFRGEVFKARSTENLRDVLNKWIARGKRAPEASRRIIEWSRCIGGNVVANYFVAVMEHVYEGGPKPTAPWLA